VGGFIVLTNSRTILNSFDVTGATAATVYLSITVLWAAAIAWSVKRYRASKDLAVSRADVSEPTASAIAPA